MTFPTRSLMTLSKRSAGSVRASNKRSAAASDCSSAEKSRSRLFVVRGIGQLASVPLMNLNGLAQRAVPDILQESQCIAVQVRRCCARVAAAAHEPERRASADTLTYLDAMRPGRVLTHVGVNVLAASQPAQPTRLIL
jgi:hypothetical protein